LFAPSDLGLFLHGSAASRMLNTLKGGTPCCVSVTVVDGIVLARSAFNHSMNYRSVVAFGVARKIEDDDAKTAALRRISEHVVKGRWNDVRPPTAKELKATTVLEFVIEEASAKIRSGPPIDDDEDYALPVWAGVLPLRIEACAPEPDPRLVPGVSAPEYLFEFGAKVRRPTAK
jgi:nitroimidazol reductase NimA-like FMN-containing flavoprotein (pyridoxamine 5'-phosphate oxidase superfamily)